MQIPVGDLHNFGAAVQKIELNGSIYYKKPRTMFWENLFFGESSPLKSVFQNTLLSNYFCLAEVQFEGELLQKAIIPSHSCNFHFENFGFLMAYCFCMGLQDLHYRNVIVTDISVQPIDVEVVFSNLLGPSQTLLVPGSNIEFARSALGCLFSSSEQFSQKNILDLINGFYNGMLKILNLTDEILHVLPSEEFHKINNRIIFRNTREYFSDGLDLIPEEKVQLDRGDVPYFFKKFSSKNIYYFNAKNEFVSIRNLPSKFQKIVDTIGWLPESILSKERLREKTIPFGILGLTARFLTHLNGLSKIELSNGSIELHGNFIIFNSHKRFELRV